MTDLLNSAIPPGVFIGIGVVGGATAGFGHWMQVPVLIPGGLGVAVAAFVCFKVADYQRKSRQEKQRDDERETQLRTLAAEFNFEFLERADRKEFIDFELHHMGTMRSLSKANGKLRNLMRRSKQDVQFYIFEYVCGSYGRGDTNTLSKTGTVRTPCAVIIAEEAGLPDFICRPESWGDIVLFGTDSDLDLPDRPLFSKLFHLSCADTTDEAGVIRVFNEALTTYLESHEDVTIETVAGRVAIYREGVICKLTTPDIRDFPDMREFIEEAITILRLIDLAG